MASGDSLIPNGVIDSFKLSNKAITIHNGVRTTNAGESYTSFIPTNSMVSNNVTMPDEPSNNVILISYTASNTPLTQSTPKPIDYVEGKVTFSNSHSIYRAGNITNMLGKVAVGDGEIDFESNQVNNLLLDENGSIVTNPSHIAPQLSSSSSPASKSFYTTAVEDDSVFDQVFVQEMVWDFDVDSGYYDAVNVGSSDDKHDYTSGTLYRWDSGALDGRSGFALKDFTDFAITGVNNRTLIHENGIDYIVDSSNSKDFRLWNGTGFGDTGKFDSLTNGVTTDLNNKQCKTVVASAETQFRSIQ